MDIFTGIQVLYRTYYRETDVTQDMLWQKTGVTLVISLAYRCYTARQGYTGISQKYRCYNGRFTGMLVLYCTRHLLAYRCCTGHITGGQVLDWTSFY